MYLLNLFTNSYKDLDKNMTIPYKLKKKDTQTSKLKEYLNYFYILSFSASCLDVKIRNTVYDNIKLVC